MNDSCTNDRFDHFKTGIRLVCLFSLSLIVHFIDNTAHLKTIELLTHSNKKHASNSSSDGERTVSVKQDSIK